MSHEFFNGAIVAWSGTLQSIPRGWTLCDGTNGTPDLRDRFVRGSAAQAGPTGGEVNHSHFALSDAHTHEINVPFLADILLGIELDQTTSTSGDNLFSDNASSDPPYYDVAYIMEWEGW